MLLLLALLVAPAVTEEPLSAAGWWKEYAANPSEMDEQYVGKVVTVRGLVNSVGLPSGNKKRFPKPVLGFRSDRSFGGESAGQLAPDWFAVYGVFDTKHNAAIAALKSGERVTIRGKVEGWHGPTETVKLVDCEIIRP